MKLVFAILVCVAAPAQGRFEFQPFTGFRFGGDLHSSEGDPNPVRLNSSVTAGATLGYSFTRHAAAEVLYSIQPTNLTLHQALVNLLLTVDYKRWQPYVLFGVGAMHIAGVASGGTKFSYNAGGGAKYWLSKHVGIRIQARWVPTYLYSTPSQVQCSYYGCSDKKEHDLNQGEVTFGWVFRN